MKWSELSNKDKVKLIIVKIMKWPHVFEKDEEYSDRLWETGRYISIGYPVAILHGQCWTVFYEEEQDGSMFDPLHDMNDAWSLIKPEDEIILYNPIPNKWRCKIGFRWTGDGITAQDAICIAKLRDMGVEIEP